MSNQSLVVSRSKLLEALLEIRGQSSLAGLRAQVLHLRGILSGAKPDLLGLLSAESSDESVLQRKHDSVLQSFREGSFSEARNDSVSLSRQHLVEDLDQIAESRTVERAMHYVERLQRGIEETRTGEINDINLSRWKEYDDIITDSLWFLEKRDTSGVHTAGYWGNFVPQIPNQLMRRYTKRGEWVLDAFAGCGTTLIESQRLGRNAIGIELQPAVAGRALDLVSSEPNEHGVVSEVVVGDSATVDARAHLAKHGRQCVQLVIMHPPYFDIIKFSDDPRDLCNADSVEAFLEMLVKVVDNVSQVLDAGRYLALVIGDKYSRGEWIPLGFRAMNEVLKRGFSLKSIVVKNFEQTAGKRSQSELWRYRALVGGFYIFKHEYLFLFRKNSSAGRKRTLTLHSP